MLCKTCYACLSHIFMLVSILCNINSSKLTLNKTFKTALCMVEWSLLKFSLKDLIIIIKSISFCSMPEMLNTITIVLTIFDCISQKVFEIVRKQVSYLSSVSSYLCLQHIKCELNWVIVRRIRRKKLEKETASWLVLLKYHEMRIDQLSWKISQADSQSRREWCFWLAKISSDVHHWFSWSTACMIYRRKAIFRTWYNTRVKSLFLKDKLYEDEKSNDVSQDSISDRATSKNFLSSISELISFFNRSHRMTIDERELARLREDLVNHFCMILKMHLVHEINVASWTRACNRLPVWMMAKMLSIEVQFSIVMTEERSQTSRRW